MPAAKIAFTNPVSLVSEIKSYIILGKSWVIYSCLFNKLLVRYVPLAITFLILFLTLVQFHLRCRNWYWHSDWANVTPSVMVCNKPGAFLQMSTNFGRLRRLFLHICFGLSTKSLPEVLYKKKLLSERQIMVCVTIEENDTFLHTDCRTKRAETKTNKGCSSHMGRYLYKYQFWVPCGHWPDLWGGEEADHVVESACSYQRPWGGVKYWFRICLQ